MRPIHVCSVRTYLEVSQQESTETMVGCIEYVWAEQMLIEYYIAERNCQAFLSRSKINSIPCLFLGFKGHAHQKGFEIIPLNHRSSPKKVYASTFFNF
jgi:hypothetical protein